MSAAIALPAYDALFQYIIDNSTHLVACVSEPADYAATQGAAGCGQGAISSTEWAINAGQAGRVRRLDFLGKTGLTTSTKEGAVAWWAFVNVAGTALIAKLPTAPAMPVSVGSTIDAPPKTALVQFAAPTVDLVG